MERRGNCSSLVAGDMALEVVERVGVDQAVVDHMSRLEVGWKEDTSAEAVDMD